MSEAGGLLRKLPTPNQLHQPAKLDLQDSSCPFWSSPLLEAPVGLAKRHCKLSRDSRRAVRGWQAHMSLHCEMGFIDFLQTFCESILSLLASSVEI